MDESSTEFHSPPGWPRLPAGFAPGPDWEKPVHWGAAPAGWSFYTRNGQQVPAPADAWQPRSTDYASAPAEQAQATATPARATPGWPAAAAPDRAGSTAGGRGRLVPVAIAVVAVVVLAAVGVHLFRAHAAAEAKAPLTHAQLVDALNPGDDKTVAGLKLTQIDELAPVDVLQGYVCQDEVFPVFAGSDGTAVESRDSGGGIDPVSQTVVPGGLTIDAALLTTTNEAQVSYGPTTSAATDCFVDRVQATPGPSGEDYRSAIQENGGMTFVFLTHRNVVALMRFNTLTGPVDVQKGVDDVDKLLDDVR